MSFWWCPESQKLSLLLLHESMSVLLVLPFRTDHRDTAGEMDLPNGDGGRGTDDLRGIDHRLVFPQFNCSLFIVHHTRRYVRVSFVNVTGWHLCAMTEVKGQIGA